LSMTVNVSIFRNIFAIGVMASAVVMAPAGCSNKQPVSYRPVTPERGAIKNFISTTGTVRPRNRLEIKPSINGRVERVLVEEGRRVRKGQVLAWMSSTERAALIDAARLQGDSQLKYWEEAYKPSPLIAPITGTVIVRDVEPGQTVTTASAVLVLADRLVVYADVDETDIGKVSRGQRAEISLDPYPEVKVNGVVFHISYESKVQNNVTMYEVEIAPDRVPPVFRSGMSAAINIIQTVKENALLIPLETVVTEGGRSFVLLGRGRGKDPEKREVKLGIFDETRVEVLSGIDEHSPVLVEVSPDRNKDGRSPGNKNPFMPTRKKRG